MRVLAPALPLALAALAPLAACRPGPTAAPASPAPASALLACPRGASPDAQGRCVCAERRAVVLGACVEDPVGAAYCGPAARLDPAGTCRFRSCASAEALDLDGACVPVSSLARVGPACAAAAAPTSTVVGPGARATCVPEDAACPRGTHATNGACRAAPTCSAGALWAGGACRPVVHRGKTGSVVDLPIWADAVLGPSGGLATAEVCRSLQARPEVLELAPQAKASVAFTVSLRIPDQDLSRVYAEVRARGRPPPPAAAHRLDEAVQSLIEVLRSFGGESSSAAVDLDLRCDVESP